MSGGPSRRDALRAIAASALLPALGWSAIGRSAVSGAAIQPPRAPMLFVRRVTRELPGGYAIVVERGFSVRFGALADGFRVAGAQVSSLVDAPPNLSDYAQIEQQRIETGIFPLELDASGLIRSTPGPIAPAGIAQGVELALAQLKGLPLADGDKDDARAFLLGLEQAAGKIASAPPPNLFTPPAEAEIAARDVVLPGGLSGSIASRFFGTVSPATGLLEQAERVITTETAGSSRRTLEHWSLESSAAS